MCTNKVCNVITVNVKREKYRPSWAVDLKKIFFFFFLALEFQVGAHFIFFKQEPETLAIYPALQPNITTRVISKCQISDADPYSGSALLKTSVLDLDHYG